MAPITSSLASPTPHSESSPSERGLAPPRSRAALNPKDDVGRHPGVRGERPARFAQCVEQIICRATVSRRALRRRRRTAITSPSSPFRIGFAAGPKREPAISIGTHDRGRSAPGRPAGPAPFLPAWRSRTPTAGDGQTAHLFAVVSGEHLGEVTDPEAHLGAERRRQQFARDFGRVDGRGGVRQLSQLPHARAGRRRSGAAGWRGGSRAFRPAPPARSAARARQAASGSTSCSICWRARAKSCGGPEQPRLGRLAVAPGAAGLLVIGLDRSSGWRRGPRSRTSGLSMPMPKATVATITISSERRTPPGCARGPAARARRDRAAPGRPLARNLLGDLLGLVAARRVDDRRPRLRRESSRNCLPVCSRGRT